MKRGAQLQKKKKLGLENLQTSEWNRFYVVWTEVNGL